MVVVGLLALVREYKRRRCWIYDVRTVWVIIMMVVVVGDGGSNGGNDSSLSLW